MRIVNYHPYQPGMESVQIMTDKCSLMLNLSKCYPAPKVWMRKLDKLFDQLIFPNDEIIFYAVNIIEYLTDHKIEAQHNGDMKTAAKYEMNIQYYKQKLQ